MNQGKLDMVNQGIEKWTWISLGISEQNWTGMTEFNSYDHYIYYCGQESLRRNGVALLVNKESEMQYLVAILKMTEWSQVCFQGKSSNITVIQVYAPTTDVEEAEVYQFNDDLQDFLELTSRKDVLFIIGDWNTKVGSWEIPGVMGKFDFGAQNEWSRTKPNRDL